MELDTIVCADAVEYTEGLADDSVDLIVTSPPYDNLRAYHGYTWNFEGIASNSYRVLKPGGVLVWVMGNPIIKGCETLTAIRQALYFVDNVGFQSWQTTIWDKNAMPGDFGKRYRPCFEYMFVMSKGEPKAWNPLRQKNATAGQKKNKGSANKTGWHSGDIKVTPETSILSNVWYIPVGAATATDDSLGKHPAMFPEALAERHILTWTNPGDIVLDYFMGSGTTAKMARNNGRHYLGCDLSEAYVQIALDRLAQPYTPQLFADAPAAASTVNEQPALL